MPEIPVTKESYNFARKYDEIKQDQDGLCKSWDDRILELLRRKFEEQKVKLGDYRSLINRLKPYYLEKTSKIDAEYFLELSDITVDYLTILCYRSGYSNFSWGLEMFLDKAINQITIDGLKTEIKEMEQEIIRNHNNLHLAER